MMSESLGFPKAKVSLTITLFCNGGFPQVLLALELKAGIKKNSELKFSLAHNV